MQVIAFACCLLWTQSGGSFDDARDGFRDWQMRMLRERAETPQALRRILSHHIPVPPPHVDGKPDGASVRMDFGSIDPLGLLPALPVVDSKIGNPVMKVTVQGKASVFEVFVAEHKRLLWISPDAGDAAFRTSESYFGVEGGPEGGFRPLGKLLFGVAGHDLVVESKGGLELKTAWIGGEFTVDREGKFEAGVQIGPDLVPRAFHGLAEARIQLAAEVSAPIVVQDVQWRSRWGVSQVASGAAAEVARILSGQTRCTYCSGGGSLTCRQCADRKIVACPDCVRRGRIDCSPCGAKGQVSCPTTRTCGRCSGSGVESCGSCGGSGSVTEYDTVPATETRTMKRPIEAGFDSNGRPILRMETYTVEVQTTRTVSRQATCGSCGGSRRGGSCGRCGGDGSVVCGRCSGIGRTACDDCDGVGSKTCRRCRGDLDITCPTCVGHAFTCPLCEGRGTVGR